MCVSRGQCFNFKCSVPILSNFLQGVKTSRIFLHNPLASGSVHCNGDTLLNVGLVKEPITQLLLRGRCCLTCYFFVLWTHHVYHRHVTDAECSFFPFSLGSTGNFSLTLNTVFCLEQSLCKAQPLSLCVFLYIWHCTDRKTFVTSTVRILFQSHTALSGTSLWPLG